MANTPSQSEPDLPPPIKALKGETLNAIVDLINETARRIERM